MKALPGFLILFGVAAAMPGLAAKHPACQLQSTSGINTYRSQDQVGSLVFSMKDIDKADKAPKGIDKLSFPEGKPPKFHIRKYFPATYREMIKAIKYPNRDHQILTKIYVDRDTSPFHFSEKLDNEQLDWNTEIMDLAPGQDDVSDNLLKKLKPGEHKLVFWVLLNWQEKRPDPNTKQVDWQGEFINIAKGELTVVVTP